MNANEILRKYEDANEMHFHEVDRKWIIQAMEEYAALQQTAVVRSASEIELRLKNLKLDQADCKKWYDDAYAKYESDRKYWGRGEADPTEYLEANRQLVELNVQIYQLEWVLGLRP